MHDPLYQRYSGPLPRPLRRALSAGGATAWQRRAARQAAATHGVLCRDTTMAIATLRGCERPASRARLGLFSRRLKCQRAAALRWFTAAQGVIVTVEPPQEG